MKFGMRKPSITKSLKARTTTKYKRKVKKALIPGYGKKGMGWVKIRKMLLIIKSIKRPHFHCGIYSNKKTTSNVLNLIKS